MIKAIKECDGYFFNEENKKLYGINGTEIGQIDVIDQDGDVVKLKDFFVKSKTLNFMVEEYEQVEVKDKESKETITVNQAVEKYYSQKNESISENKNWTEKPEKTKQQIKHSKFSVSTIEYKKNPQAPGVQISEVLNEDKNVNTGCERFGTVDGIMMVEGSGLWFSTPDGRKSEKVVARWEGLYYWGINRKNVDLVIKGSGRLYEMK